MTRRLAAAALDDIRRALVRLADAVLGERCTVTGERVFPADRRAHEDTQHATDGACAPVGRREDGAEWLYDNRERAHMTSGCWCNSPNASKP